MDEEIGRIENKSPGSAEMDKSRAEGNNKIMDRVVQNFPHAHDRVVLDSLPSIYTYKPISPYNSHSLILCLSLFLTLPASPSYCRP